MNTLDEMKMMVAQLNRWTKLYDEGYPEVSDKVWDEHYFRLLDFENKTGMRLPNSPTQCVSYEVVNQLNKVKHNHPMLSLAKTKDWGEFLNYFASKDVSKDVIGTVKLDGLTCSLRYLNGRLVSAETRGNGEVGEDILHNALVIKNIPKRINYTDELIIDGEIICTYKDFEPFKEEYSNPRNFAAGSIRLLDSKECAARNLTFVVWNIVKGFPESNSFMDSLCKVEKLGFTITPWTSSFDWDAAEFLENKAKKLGYPIDGLVGRFNDIAFGNSLGATGHHSNAAYAFKFYDEEYETELLDIEWSMGRTSVLTPVAIFKPVDDGVSIIEKSSLHNVSIMKETLHYPFYGQKIKVFKANQIIPQISWAEENMNPSLDFSITIPDVCPICGQPTKLIESDSGTVNLICTNPQCDGLLINKLEHYCSKKGLDIRGLSKATLEKFIDWGWISNITDIYSLSNFRKDWIQKPGFGPKSVDNILDAIEKSKNCEMSAFITALGIPLIGSTYAKEICKKENSWNTFRVDIEKKYNFMLWEGFGPEICDSLLKYDYTEADYLANNILTLNNSLINNTMDKSLEGITVAITGKLINYKNRSALQADIEAKGGKISSSVSKNTNYLINNDTTSGSSKNLTAQKLGVEIISETDFIKKFLEK